MLSLLVERYVAELQLPPALLPLCLRLVDLWHVAAVSFGRALPRDNAHPLLNEHPLDDRAAAVIVLVLKLCYGLVDDPLPDAATHTVAPASAAPALALPALGTWLHRLPVPLALSTRLGLVPSRAAQDAADADLMARVAFQQYASVRRVRNDPNVTAVMQQLRRHLDSQPPVVSTEAGQVRSASSSSFSSSVSSAAAAAASAAPAAAASGGRGSVPTGPAPACVAAAWPAALRAAACPSSAAATFAVYRTDRSDPTWHRDAVYDAVLEVVGRGAARVPDLEALHSAVEEVWRACARQLAELTDLDTRPPQ